jgi:hypothetical protein
VIELFHQWLANVLEQFNHQAGVVKGRKLRLEVQHIQSADSLRGRGTMMRLVAKFTRSYQVQVIVDVKVTNVKTRESSSHAPQ